MGGSHHPTSPAGEGASAPRTETTTNHIGSRLPPQGLGSQARNRMIRQGKPAPCERPPPFYDKATSSRSKPTRLEPKAFTMRQVSTAPQEGHHHEPRTVPTFAPSGLGATQEPTRSVRANRHPWERRRPRRPISPSRPASPRRKQHDPCHPRLTSPGSPRWPTSPHQPCSPTQIDRQTVHARYATPHPIPASLSQLEIPPNCPRAPQPNRRPRLGETLITGPTTLRTPTLQTPAPYCIVYG